MYTCASITKTRAPEKTKRYFYLIKHTFSSGTTYHNHQISFHSRNLGQRNPLVLESPRFETVQRMNLRFHLSLFCLCSPRIMFHLETSCEKQLFG